MAFFELNIAMSGLFTAQKGLQVTSNNISNANTAGYSRQQLHQKADTPLSGMGVGMTGTGVRVTGINRVRDSFIDDKLWAQNPSLGEHNVKVTQSSLLEAAFGEPSDSGFTKVFNNMFSAIGTLSKDPSANEAKAVLKEELISFTTYFNNISASLSKQQKDLNFEIKGAVQEINTLATRIQSLNEQIFKAEIYGDQANSFRDERDKCVDRLSELIDIETVEEQYEVEGNSVSKYTVKAAGQVLVSHLHRHTLEIEVREDKVNPQDVEGLYDLKWSSGAQFDMRDANLSGELKGLIDMRDGSGAQASDGTKSLAHNTYNGIPYYRNRLDDYVRKFAKAMNEQYSKKGDGTLENKALFTYSTGGAEGKLTSEHDFYYKDGLLMDSEEAYQQITAANFSIAADIYERPESIKTVYDTSNPSDTSFMLDLLAQKDNKNMFNEGDPKDYMIGIFSELGINAKEAEMYQSTHKAVTNNLKNQRQSVSEVNTSEEFTSLIKYQQAYQAAAKVMNTMDGIYETTIFKLGNF